MVSKMVHVSKQTEKYSTDEKRVAKTKIVISIMLG